MDFRISIEEFEGPLDLLAYLVKKEEVDLREFPLSKITGKYLSYLEGLKNVDFDTAGEFIKYSALLIQLKARALAYREKGENIQEDVEVKELKNRVAEYRKFLDGFEFLREKEQEAIRMYKRPFMTEFYSFNVKKEDLVDAAKSLKKQKGFNPPASLVWHIERVIHRLVEKIERLGSFPLWKTMKDCSYSEKVGTFFALLEVVRQGIAGVIQHELFGEIWVKKK